MCITQYLNTNWSKYYRLSICMHYLHYGNIQHFKRKSLYTCAYIWQLQYNWTTRCYPFHATILRIHDRQFYEYNINSISLSRHPTYFALQYYVYTIDNNFMNTLCIQSRYLAINCPRLIRRIWWHNVNRQANVFARYLSTSRREASLSR